MSNHVCCILHFTPASKLDSPLTIRAQLEPNWLKEVRPIQTQLGEPAAYIRPSGSPGAKGAAPAPSFGAGNPPTLLLGPSAGLLQWSGSHWALSRCQAAFPTLATRVPLHEQERHVAPLPRQLSIKIRRVCAQDPLRR